MINSHVHLIPESTDRYAHALVARMAEYNIRASVLFGSQCTQATSDDETRRITEHFEGSFIPFLSRSADITDPHALDTCLRELETGFWHGLGELFLDCGDDTYVRWTDEHGRDQCVTKPVPDEKEKHSLYKALFEYCGAEKLPVLVHCMDADVMARTLAAYPTTTFIWAHVDHGFYWDVAISLLERHPNLVCEFGVEFRFASKKIVSGEVETWLADHIDRWRRTCMQFPHRVVWGTDLHTWGDLDSENFAAGMKAWEKLAAALDENTRQQVTDSNISRVLGLAEQSVSQRRGKPRG